MSKSIAAVVLSAASFLTAAQTPPEIQWQRNLGGTMDDNNASVEQTSDGGYILCGTTYSNNGDVSGNHGSGDIWVVKLDADGATEWQRCLGGSQPDIGRSILELPGEGYLVIGSTRSADGDVSGGHGLADIWLARLGMDGTPTWQRCYGGSLADVPFGIQPAPDGGWIIVGESRSNDGDLTTNAGFTDYWVVKLNATFEIEWQHSYGGTGGDTAYAIALTSDGGYVLNGYSDSNDGDVSSALGSGDFWVVKINSLGSIEWERSCGGTGYDQGSSIVQLGNGNYAAFGLSSSTDLDVTGPMGSDDYWMAELSSAGDLLGDRSYGGSNADGGASLEQLPGGGRLMSGASASSDGDLVENSGSYDGWLVRTDPSGSILWQLVLGGSLSDSFGSFYRTSDGGTIVHGSSSSGDGDLPGNNGGRDIWVIKLGPDPVGIGEPALQVGLVAFPNPFHDALQVLVQDHQGTPLRWRIADREGRTVATGAITNGRALLPTSRWATGSYTLYVESRSGLVSQTVVKL